MHIGIPPLVVALVLLTPAAPSGQGTVRDLKTIDVCRLIPGTVVAGALEGTLSKATPFNDPQGGFARCAYIVGPKEGAAGETTGYVVWLYPPSQFEELRQYTEAPLTTVPGLGDAAERFVDPDDGRVKLRVLLRADVALEVTAETAATAQTVAEVAVAALRPPR